MSSGVPAAPAASTALSGLGSKHRVPGSQIVSLSRSATAAAASGAVPDGLARPWAIGVLGSWHLGSAAITSLSSRFR
eukprot:4975556-Lingulodinium_polyedra.AAC.1